MVDEMTSPYVSWKNINGRVIVNVQCRNEITDKWETEEIDMTDWSESRIKECLRDIINRNESCY